MFFVTLAKQVNLIRKLFPLFIARMEFLIASLMMAWAIADVLTSNLANNTIFANVVEGGIFGTGTARGTNGQGLGGGIYLKRVNAASVTVNSKNNTIADNNVNYLVGDLAHAQGAVGNAGGINIDPAANNNFTMLNTIVARSTKGGTPSSDMLRPGRRR